MFKKIIGIHIGFENGLTLLLKPSDFEDLDIRGTKNNYSLHPTGDEVYITSYATKGVVFTLKESANVLEKWEEYGCLDELPLPFDFIQEYPNITDINIVYVDGEKQVIWVPYKDYCNGLINRLQKSGIQKSGNLLVEIRHHKKSWSIFDDNNWYER